MENVCLGDISELQQRDSVLPCNKKLSFYGKQQKKEFGSRRSTGYTENGGKEHQHRNHRFEEQQNNMETGGKEPKKAKFF